MSLIRLHRPAGPLDATVTVPGSKSLTNRALVMAALSHGTSTLSNALAADDTERMVEALGGLGFSVSWDRGSQRIAVVGRGGHIPHCEADLCCGNSGTTMRFCAALASLGQGAYRLDGVERMRERPIGALVDGLRGLGASVAYAEREGFPPITVHACGLSGGRVVLDRVASSQFVSALLMAAPAAAGDVLVEVTGPLVSAPYLRMTTELMSVFGVAAVSERESSGGRFIVAAPQAYRATDYRVEPDASNASYFLAAPAVAGGAVTVSGLGTGSLQGDVGFVDVLERMGCGVERSGDALTVRRPAAGVRLRPVDVDLNDMPDMVQTVAALSLFASGRTVIRNVANLRVKETDRLAAVRQALVRVGATVDERADGLVIDPPERVQPASIQTYGDHRMAMSFALVGLGVDGVEIEDPECVNKTYPGFFDQWAALCRSQC